jgi:N-acetylmuramic acid 6-phosphate etherase
MRRFAFMEKDTEASGRFEDLDKMSLNALLVGINQEDREVPLAIERALPQIEALAQITHQKLAQGGRLFYLGAGTSGRLGIVDASECPPTFGVPHGMVIGIIAGGDKAIRKAVEFAEDDINGGWKDLQEYGVSNKDMVIGIAASGTTPYVVGAMKACLSAGISTGCITCNNGSPLAATAEFPVEVIVGPEFVTGSTRMKAGSAQKMVLNMISTSAMIRLGRVVGNKMVDMQLSNHKLVERGTLMVMNQTGLEKEKAKELLLSQGSVRNAVKKHHHGTT